MMQGQAWWHTTVIPAPGGRDRQTLNLRSSWSTQWIPGQTELCREALSPGGAYCYYSKKCSYFCIYDGYILNRTTFFDSAAQTTKTFPKTPKSKTLSNPQMEGRGTTGQLEIQEVLLLQILEVSMYYCTFLIIPLMNFYMIGALQYGKKVESHLGWDASAECKPWQSSYHQHTLVLQRN